MSDRKPSSLQYARVGVQCLLVASTVACTAKQRRTEAVSPVVAEARGRERDAPSSVLAHENAPSYACPEALLAARKGGRDNDRYVTPTPDKRTALRQTVERLLAQDGGANDAASGLAASAGYELVQLPEWPSTVLLRERTSEQHGGGAYVVRLGARSQTVVQAPHTFFDEGTLPLACELFQRSRSMMLFIDTAHRYLAADVDEQGDHPADVAHASDSLFQAATDGVVHVAADATLVQLHGFASRPENLRVVLSTGVSRRNEALLTRVAERIGRVIGTGVARFPDDTRELGATKNAQGIAARAVGARFLHVELESSVRKLLLGDEALRGQFLEALAASLPNP